MTDLVTGDDSVTCGLCGKETSLDVATLVNAPIIDMTGEDDS